MHGLQHVGQLVWWLAKNLEIVRSNRIVVFCSENITMSNLDRLVVEPHKALDVVLLRVPRILKDDYVPTLWIPKRWLKSELIDQNTVTRIRCVRPLARIHFL